MTHPKEGIQMETQMPAMDDVLRTLIKATALERPTLTATDGREYALVAKEFDLKDITDPHRLPPRPKSHVKVDDRASLVAYSKLHLSPASLILADYESGSIRTVLDWHPHNQSATAYTAGARDHSVTLTLLPSEEFTRWNAMEGKMHAQTDFALFLEENAADIWAPEPGIMLELARDLEAVSSQAFKARTRLENGDISFTFETESKIVSKVAAPTEFTLSIPLYNGEDPEPLVAKFRWRPTAEGLKLGFVWHRVEYMRRARFTQIATAAAEATGLPWIAGRAA